MGYRWANTSQQNCTGSFELYLFEIAAIIKIQYIREFPETEPLGRDQPFKGFEA
jgi:hypothetical protein